MKSARAKAFFGFVLLALLYTWPLALHLGDRAIGRENDSSIWMWYVWHFGWAVKTLHTNPLISKLIYWPYGVNLMLFHGLFYAVVGYALSPVLGLVGTYNAVMLQTLVLSGFFVYLIAEEWGAGPGPAFVAGALYAFSPDVSGLFFAGIGFDHLSRQVIPLFLWTLSRAMRTRRALDAAFAAAALCVVWGCDFYFFLNCCVLIPVIWLAYEKPVTAKLEARALPTAPLDAALAAVAAWLIWSLRAGQQEFHGRGSARALLLYVAPYAAFWGLLGLRLLLKRRVVLTWNPKAWSWDGLKPYASTIGFWSVLNLPLIVAILRARGDYGTTPSPWRGGGNPTDIGWFLLPSVYSGIWGSTLRKFVEPAPSSCFGWATIFGAVWLWRRKLQDRWVTLWFAGAAFGILVTMGPWLKAFGVHTYLPLPFYFLHLLPFYNNIQTGYRLEPFAMVFLALLFAAFLREYMKTVPKHRAAWVPAIAFAILLVEFTPSRLPLYDPAIPPLFERLGARPDGAILPVPWGAAFNGLGPEGFIGRIFLPPHYQTAHHKPVIGGTIGRMPRRVYEATKNDALLMAVADAQAGAKPAPLLSDAKEVGRRLKELPVRYVLVKTTETPEALQAVIKKWPVKLIDQDETLRLYSLD